MRRASIIILAIASVAAGCAGKDQKGDASARLACDRFRALANDYTDGLLTISELRDRVKGVHDRAWVSETAGIADAATDMLARITATFDPSDPQFNDAVKRMGTACRAIDK